VAEAAIAITNELPVPGNVPVSPKRMAIVAAAGKLFVGNGFGATSMDAIAAEANVSKRTVYSHFDNKEALFAGVMEEACTSQRGEEGCPLNCDADITAVPPKEMLHQVALHVLTIITAQQTTELFRVVMGESGRFPELGRTFWDNGPGWVLETVTDYLGAATAAGLLNVDDPKKAARQFFGLMVDPIKLELTLGLRGEPTAAEVETMSADAAEAFLKIYG